MPRNIIIFNLNLSQLVCEPTHIAGNTLDLILTSIFDCIINGIIQSEPPLPNPSDHFIITFDVHVINHDEQCGGTITLFDFSRGDYTSLKHF